MRHLNFPTNFLTILLTLFAVGLTQADGKGGSQDFSAGDLLTITSRNAPENTKMVTYSLDREARGLLMRPSGTRQWSGRFLIFPGQAGKTLRPVLTYYLKNGSTLTETLEPIKVSSTQSRQPGAVSRTRTGRLICVFDQVVRADTVRAVTLDGESRKVRHENNYFVLPSTVSHGNLRSVTAQTIHGETVILTPGPALQAHL